MCSSGDLHSTTKCTLKKEDLTKKCSNCGGKHAANYRCCPVYKDLKSKLSLGVQARRKQMMNIPRSEIIEITDQSSKPGYVKNNVVHGSYANVVKVTKRWDWKYDFKSYPMYATIYVNNAKYDSRSY